MCIPFLNWLVLTTSATARQCSQHGPDRGLIGPILRPMLVLPEEAVVLGKLVACGEAHPSIRALILTSSRAKPDGCADVLSD